MLNIENRLNNDNDESEMNDKSLNSFWFQVHLKHENTEALEVML